MRSNFNYKPEEIQKTLQEQMEILKIMGKFRERPENTDDDIINEIIAENNTLIPKAHEIVTKETPENILTILENHKKYLLLMSNKMEKIKNTIGKLETCIEIFTNATKNKMPTLEIIIEGTELIGKFKDTQCVYKTEITHIDKNQTKYIHTIHIDLQNLPTKIHIVSETRRSIILNMVYSEGMLMVYNIKFDLSCVDPITNIVNGTYNVMRY